MHMITTFIIIIALVYCEFIGDYVKLYQCSWPKLGNEIYDGEKTLRALILADTHLLGPNNGHWLDKFYREWHMHRSFQAAVTLFNPDVIFVLGDLFDEGDIVNAEQFKEYVTRFHKTFIPKKSVPIVSAVGNHDIGFHYKMFPYLVQRFKHNFNNTGVKLYTFKNIHFIVINSMAMQNDGCNLCESVQYELHKISSLLNCMKNSEKCDNKKDLSKYTIYSRPILLQHFPTFRISDKICIEHDSPTIIRFRENWEVLSRNATRQLGKLLNPRAAFAGHSHHFCRNINMLGIEEFTVASFSWRNKLNPSFLLTSFSLSNYSVFKCDMMHQETVYNIYIITAVISMSLILWQTYKLLQIRSSSIKRQ